MRLVPSNMFKHSSTFNDCYKVVLLSWILFVIFISCLSVIMSCLFLAAMYIVTCWERAGLLALLYVMFSYVCFIFPSGVVLDSPDPDLCFLP